MKANLLTYFKDTIRSMLKLFAKYACKIGFTPNMITVIGLTVAVASAMCYAFRVNIFLASGLYFLSAFFDVLDGTIASSFNRATVFGAFLDSLLDRYSDTVIILGIIFGGFCDPRLGMIALVGSLLVSYARARGEALNITLISVGLAERAERILIIIIASLLTPVYDGALSIGMVLLAITTHITVLQRAHHVWKLVNSTDKVI